MTGYKFSQDELLAFAKKIYEEACYGYMDLKESVCDALVREFLDGREIVSSIDTNVMAVPDHGNAYNGSIVTYGSGMTFTASSANEAMIAVGMGDVSINVNEVLHGFHPMNSTEPPPAAAPVSTEPPVSTFERWGQTWESPQVRPEEYVRIEQNFLGNESERI